MMSVRECLDHPQVLSTDRHLMQGYLDLMSVEWDENQKLLSGVSKVIGVDQYTISIALNGFRPEVISYDNPGTETDLTFGKDGAIRMTLERPENATVKWSVSFNKNMYNN